MNDLQINNNFMRFGFKIFVVQQRFDRRRLRDFYIKIAVWEEEVKGQNYKNQ